MRNEDRLKLIAARQKLIDDAKAVVPTQEPTVQEPVPEVVEEPTPVSPPEVAEDDLNDEDVVIEDVVIEDVVIEDEWPSIESEPPTDD